MLAAKVSFAVHTRSWMPVPSVSETFMVGRENDNTYRLLESRRQRNLHKMDAQGV